MTTVAERLYAEWLEAIQKLGRAPDEWIAKTPDSAPPPRVADRILRTWDGRCYLSTIEIAPGTPWETEHVIPLSLGGENRESNLRPALSIEHRKKSRAEAKARAKADRTRRAQNGTRVVPKAKIKSAGFPQSSKPRMPKPQIAPRALYRS